MNHLSFLRDNAQIEPPVRFQALLMLLASKAEILDPRKTDGLHPLLLPLAQDCNGHVLGFLRWPTPPDDTPLPIVRQAPDGLHLLAASCDNLIHRELAWRDVTEGESPGSLLRAANASGLLYEEGSVVLTGLPLNAYLLIKVGVPPSFFERLATAHLKRGDAMAAEVTADRACRSAPGWARPQAFRALLLDKIGKPEEARDAALTALLNPVWTLGHPFEPIARLAGWVPPITSEPYRTLSRDSTRSPLDRAAYLMDAAYVEGQEWTEIRSELGKLYREAGLEFLGELVDR